MITIKNKCQKKNKKIKKETKTKENKKKETEIYKTKENKEKTYILLKNIILTITTTIILTIIDYTTKKNHYKKEEFIFNKGISFGILKEIKEINIIMIIFSITILLFLIFYILKIIYNIQDYEKPTIQLTALTLLTSGLIGNLISRIKYGAVIDFLKLEFLRYKINFPQFNYADVYITTGVIIYTIYLLFLDKKY